MQFLLLKLNTIHKTRPIENAPPSSTLEVGHDGGRIAFLKIMRISNICFQVYPDSGQCCFRKNEETDLCTYFDLFYLTVM